jgi:hypothetical protein
MLTLRLAFEVAVIFMFVTWPILAIQVMMVAFQFRYWKVALVLINVPLVLLVIELRLEERQEQEIELISSALEFRLNGQDTVELPDQFSVCVSLLDLQFPDRIVHGRLYPQDNCTGAIATLVVTKKSVDYGGYYRLEYVVRVEHH